MSLFDALRGLPDFGLQEQCFVIKLLEQLWVFRVCFLISLEVG